MLFIHELGNDFDNNVNLDSSHIKLSGIAQLDRLPDPAEEITSIAQALGADLKQDVFLGNNASKHRI